MRPQTMDAKGKMMLAFVLSCTLFMTAHAKGCAELFDVGAWAHLAALSSGSQDKAEAVNSARHFVRWHSWALMNRSLGGGELVATHQDVTVGRLSGQITGWPSGAPACLALARRRQADGSWDAVALAARVQVAIEELALIDWELSRQEVSRLNAEATVKAEQAARRVME